MSTLIEAWLIINAIVLCICLSVATLRDRRHGRRT